MSVQKTRSLTPIPVLTLLAFCWPFMNFLNVNQSMLGAPQVMSVATYLGLCLAAVLSLWILLIVTRVPRRIRLGLDASLAISVALFFAFPILMNLIASALAILGQSSGGFIVYGALLALAFAVMFWVGRVENARSFFLVFLLIATALPTARYILFEVRQFVTSVTSDTSGQAPVGARFDLTPDVFFLIMDSYPRNDTLKQFFDHDDSEFLDALRARGFIVNEDFNANYPSTFLSLSSVLEMDYVATPEEIFENRDPYIAAIVGSGRVQEHFRSAGYLIAHGSYKVTAGGCQGNEDYCVDKGLGATFGEIEYGILSLTPIAALLSRAQFLGLPPQTLDQYINAVSSVPLQDDVFYFIHSNPPHPPFFLTEDCIDGAVSSIEATESDPTMKTAFAHSVDCSGQGAIKLIDHVLSENPDALIILQSDHGSSSTVDWTVPAVQWSEEQAEERLASLSAIRAPARCEETVKGLRSSVNTFRVVIACLENRQPDLLADRYFLNTYENVSDFGQVREVFPRPRAEIEW